MLTNALRLLQEVLEAKIAVSYLDRLIGFRFDHI